MLSLRCSINKGCKSVKGARTRGFHNEIGVRCVGRCSTAICKGAPYLSEQCINPPPKCPVHLPIAKWREGRNDGAREQRRVNDCLAYTVPAPSIETCRAICNFLIKRSALPLGCTRIQQTLRSKAITLFLCYDTTNLLLDAGSL